MKLSTLLKSAIAGVALAGFVAACAPAAEAPKAEEKKVEAPAPAPAEPATIIDAAAANPEFSTLVAAITAAGLGDALKGAGPFTVFAPSNAAFAKIPKATLDGLLTPEKKADLTKILQLHVVPGRVMAADLAGVKTTAATLEGRTLTVDTATPGTVKINGATVTQADIKAGNGVIHVIDTVILP